MKKNLFITLCVAIITLPSCVTIQPGEVGVKQKLGKLDQTILEEGLHSYFPLTTRIIIAPVRTENIELSLNLPSREGLNVGSEISILYRIEKQKVPYLIETIGLNYENIIKSVFRSSSADVCAQFYAKDMHSGKRAEIENEIRKKMHTNLEERGIIIEAVLMKSIKLPDGLYSSIEDRLQAEQDAMRMQFIIQQEQLEAERKIIEAEGNRDAQKILSEGLTEQILQLRKIEAFLKLAQSPNAKVIIGSGTDTPVMVGDE